MVDSHKPSMPLESLILTSMDRGSELVNSSVFIVAIPKAEDFSGHFDQLLHSPSEFVSTIVPSTHDIGALAILQHKERISHALLGCGEPGQDAEHPSFPQ